MPILNMVGGGSNKKKFYCVVISAIQPINPVENMIWIKSNITCQNIKLIDDVKNATMLNTMYLVVSDELVDIDLSEVGKLYNTDFQSFKLNKSNQNKGLAPTHFKLQQWGYITTYAIPVSVIYVDGAGIKTELDASIYKNVTWDKFTNKNIILIRYMQYNPQVSKMIAFNSATMTPIKEVEDKFGRINYITKRIHSNYPTQYWEYDFNLNQIVPLQNLNITTNINSPLIDYKNDFVYYWITGYLYKYQISTNKVITTINVGTPYYVFGIIDQGDYIVCQIDRNPGAGGFKIYNKATMQEITGNTFTNTRFLSMKDNLIYCSDENFDEEGNLYGVAAIYDMTTKIKKTLQWTWVGQGYDNKGNMYVTNGSRAGSIVCKFSPSGQEITRITLPVKYGEYKSIDVDIAGNILALFGDKYICFSSTTGQEIYSLDLIKYCTNPNMARGVDVTNLNR